MMFFFKKLAWLKNVGINGLISNRITSKQVSESCDEIVQYICNLKNKLASELIVHLITLVIANH